MNKIYRVIWNSSLCVWMAASELAKSNTKSKSKTVGSDAAQQYNNKTILAERPPFSFHKNKINLALAVTAGFTLFAPSLAFSQDINEDLNVTGDLTVSGTVNGVDIATLNSNVGQAQTDITSLQSSVAVKASQTSVDSLGTRVTTAEGKISTLESTVNNTSTGLATKASRADLTALQTTVSSLGNNPITFTGDTGSTAKKLGETLAVAGGKNISTSVSGDILTVDLDDDIILKSATASGAIKSATLESTGNTTVGGFLAVTGAATLNGGASLNNKEITNLGAGNISSASSTDAVNGGQLYTVNKNIADALGTTLDTSGVLVASTYTVNNGQGSTTQFTNVKDALAFITGVDSGTGVGIKYFHTNSAKDDSQAKGTDAIAVGPEAIASGVSSIAMGANANATATGSVALGATANASQVAAVALGRNAMAATTGGISIGDNAGVNSVQGQTNDRTDLIAIGRNTGQNVVGNRNIALGVGAGSNLSADADSSSDDNIAIGVNAGSNINGDDNIAIGRNANANVSQITESVAIGSDVDATTGSTVLGNSAKATGGGYATVVGYGARVTGDSGTALGRDSEASTNNVALGTSSIANGTSTDAAYLTDETKASGFNIVSVGQAGQERRITNVAAGSNNTDAVNVSQLKQAQQKVADLIGGQTTVNNAGNFGGYIVELEDTVGTKHQYKTVAEAINAVSSGQISVLPGNAVLYTADGRITNLTAGTSGTDAVNLNQLNAAIAANGQHHVSINSTEPANQNNTGAAATNSLAIGAAVTTSNTATNSVAMGFDTAANAQNSVAIGNNQTQANGISSIAMGQNTKAKSTNNIAMGTNASSNGTDSIAIGKNIQIDYTTDTSNYAVGMGSEAEVQNADQAIAIGRKAIVQGDNGNAIGHEALAAEAQATALGNHAQALSTNTNAIGNYAVASGTSSNAIGNQADATAANATAIGTSARAYAAGANALGNSAQALQQDATAIGTSAKASGVNATAIGTDALASAENALANGTGAKASKNSAMALGNT